MAPGDAKVIKGATDEGFLAHMRERIGWVECRYRSQPGDYILDKSVAYEKLLMQIETQLCVGELPRRR